MHSPWQPLSYPNVKPKATLGERAFLFAAPKLWNAVPRFIRESISVDTFKRGLLLRRSAKLRFRAAQECSKVVTLGHRMSRSCCGISSRYFRVVWCILLGKEINMRNINKEELIIISYYALLCLQGLNQLTCNSSDPMSHSNDCATATKGEK